MDTKDQVPFNEPGFSTNITNSSTKKKEKLVAQILATKFHTTPVDEPWSGEEIKLNPLMKDLIINSYVGEHHAWAVKRKQSKHQKTTEKTEVVESVGENQRAWLDTLKEEIANLK